MQIPQKRILTELVDIIEVAGLMFSPITKHPPIALVGIIILPKEIIIHTQEVRVILVHIVPTILTDHIIGGNIAKTVS